MDTIDVETKDLVNSILRFALRHRLPGMIRLLEELLVRMRAIQGVSTIVAAMQRGLRR